MTVTRPFVPTVACPFASAIGLVMPRIQFASKAQRKRLMPLLRDVQEGVALIRIVQHDMRRWEAEGVDPGPHPDVAQAYCAIVGHIAPRRDALNDDDRRVYQFARDELVRRSLRCRKVVPRGGYPYPVSSPTPEHAA